MTTITRKEGILLDCLARNCYTTANYGRPETFTDAGATWSSEILNTGSKFSDELTPKSLGGLVASLVEKGLVTADNTGDRDDTTGLTEAGFEVWRASEFGTYERSE